MKKSKFYRRRWQPHFEIDLDRVYKKKGNPTLACHCALVTGCMNVIFA